MTHRTKYVRRERKVVKDVADRFLNVTVTGATKAAAGFRKKKLLGR